MNAIKKLLQCNVSSHNPTWLFMLKLLTKSWVLHEFGRSKLDCRHQIPTNIVSTNYGKIGMLALVINSGLSITIFFFFSIFVI
jgi:hypothetical protein